MNIIFDYTFLLFSFVWFVFFGYLFISFVFRMLLPLVFFGALYIPSKDKEIETMVELARISGAKTAIDLGAGDGRIVMALAGQGIQAHGYEINPLLVFEANRNIKKAGLQTRAFVHWGNFWNQDFSQFDLVVIYGISFAMEKLEKKLAGEAKPGAKIISNYFRFPTWLPTHREGRVYVYEKK